jgi:DNA (cytosine-5)-methyltransferase 1
MNFFQTLPHGNRDARGLRLLHTSLFSGIGGFELAISPNSPIKTTQFVEIDENAIAILKARFPKIKLHKDIKTYQPQQQGGLYTIGFPCTGTSGAGTRTGLDHAESGLWYEALRCIHAGKPNFIIIENPIGITHNGLRCILGGLRMGEYSWDAPEVIHIDALGGPQKRARLFVVAYTNDADKYFKCRKSTPWNEQIRAEIAIAHSERIPTQSQRVQMDDGIPNWLGRVNSDWGKLPAIGMRSHTKLRRECISLYARSVCPAQAAFAIRRVEYLWEKLNREGEKWQY